MTITPEQVDAAEIDNAAMLKVVNDLAKTAKRLEEAKATLATREAELSKSQTNFAEAQEAVAEAQEANNVAGAAACNFVRDIFEMGA